MHLTRKRALVVAGAVAGLLGGGAALAPTQAAINCPVNVVCVPIEASSDGLGIIPDPTREIIESIISEPIFLDEGAPVYSALNATFAPTEATVYSLTYTAIEAENQVSPPATALVQESIDQTGAPVTLYSRTSDECVPKHDHKDHENHKHCEGDEND